MRPQPFFEQYMHWLHRASRDLEVVKLSCILDNRKEIERCHGLLLTGGGDIHPRAYHSDSALKRVEEVNERRDEFEFGVLDDALRLQLPILGVCRGMQLFNVAMGGTLIPDLEDAGFESHRQRGMPAHHHPLVVEENSMLYGILGTVEGRINTIHHQAVDRPGWGLRVTGRSHDGVPEALEWEDTTRIPWLLLVQWHPERMEDTTNPCSERIATRFVAELERSSAARTTRKNVV